MLTWTVTSQILTWWHRKILHNISKIAPHHSKLPSNFLLYFSFFPISYSWPTRNITNHTHDLTNHQTTAQHTTKLSLWKSEGLSHHKPPPSQQIDLQFITLTLNTSKQSYPLLKWHHQIAPPTLLSLSSLVDLCCDSYQLSIS